MKTYVICLAVVKSGETYLIGKRAKTKKFAPNKWEFISGFIEKDESIEETILRELEEETKLNGKLVKSANPYVIIDEEARWITISFLIEVSNNNFTISKKDHSELKWLTKEELNNYPDLKSDIMKLKEANILT